MSRGAMLLLAALPLLTPCLHGCKTSPVGRASGADAEGGGPASRPASAPAKPEGDGGDTPAALKALAARIAAPAAPHALTAERAGRFAALTLHCQARPYPNKPSHVYDGDETIKPPRQLTPAFYGCFDWHSAVHGHWAMVRLLARFGAKLPEAPKMRAALAAHLTKDKLEAERAFFALERNRLFERPYGWAWLMRLQAELRGWKDRDGERFAAALAPLTAQLVARMRSYLQRLSVPVRAGTHASTAFAMTHMLDYARSVDDEPFAALLVQRARDFFGKDRACPTAYEPSGEDFISPCLVEADLMRRVLPGDEFARWLGHFLPPLTSERFAPLRSPPEVRDPKDPRIGHLIGLSLQRAWSMAGIASALPKADPRRPVLDKLSRLHRQHALSQMFGSGYGGSHWLASFAVYLLTGVGLG